MSVRREQVASHHVRQVFFLRSFMHLDRNVCRSLPCRPFASACLEHSIDSAVRGFWGGFAVGVVLLAAGGFAGGVCAITAFAERRLMIATTVTIRIRRPPVCGQRCARSRISWTHGTRQLKCQFPRPSLCCPAHPLPRRPARP